MGSMKKRLTLLGVVVSLAAIAVLSSAVSVAQGVGGTLILAVDVDEASFVGPAAGVQGAFNLQGDTGSGAKSFQCWGWIFEDGSTTNVSQVYNIAGRGAIMIQGQEGGFLAVVGGTGDFSNVRGQGLQVFTGTGFDFTMTFDLQGAGPNS